MRTAMAYLLTAQKDGLAQVKVHRKDGKTDYESNYGNDPRDIRG